MNYPFRDFSITPGLALVALTIIIVEGNTRATLTRPWFLAFLAVVAVSIGFDLWRARRGPK
jgi:hypothetical protein